MSLYYRNLKLIGICVIIASVGNLIQELGLRNYLSSISSVYLEHVPLIWGIWTKNMIGVLAGAVALLFYRIRKHYRTGTVILTLLCAAETAVIVLSMTGSAGRRVNGMIDLTLLMMTLLAYTISETGRDLRRWEQAGKNKTVTLDLRLQEQENFFDPIQIGPRMAINPDYAQVVNRYISSLRTPAPLQINLFCRSAVTEQIRNMMREVFIMHYETEEDRIGRNLEKRYRRIMLLVTVSIFAIGIIRQFMLLNEEVIVWDIIGNFSAFGLWQIGYTHYERDEEYEELLQVHIAKHARLNFIDKAE